MRHDRPDAGGLATGLSRKPGLDRSPIKGAAALKAAVDYRRPWNTTTGRWPGESPDARRPSSTERRPKSVRLFSSSIARSLKKIEKNGEDETRSTPSDGTSSARFCHPGGQQDEQPQREPKGCKAEEQGEDPLHHAANQAMGCWKSVRKLPAGSIIPSGIPAILAGGAGAGSSRRRCPRPSGRKHWATSRG